MSLETPLDVLPRIDIPNLQIVRQPPPNFRVALGDYIKFTAAVPSYTDYLGMIMSPEQAAKTGKLNEFQTGIEYSRLPVTLQRFFRPTQHESSSLEASMVSQWINPVTGESTTQESKVKDGFRLFRRYIYVDSKGHGQIKSGIPFSSRKLSIMFDEKGKPLQGQAFLLWQKQTLTQTDDLQLFYNGVRTLDFPLGNIDQENENIDKITENQKLRESLKLSSKTQEYKRYRYRYVPTLGEKIKRKKEFLEEGTARLDIDTVNKTYTLADKQRNNFLSKQDGKTDIALVYDTSFKTQHPNNKEILEEIFAPDFSLITPRDDKEGIDVSKNE